MWLLFYILLGSRWIFRDERLVANWVLRFEALGFAGPQAVGVEWSQDFQKPDPKVLCSALLCSPVLSKAVYIIVG